MAIDSVDSQNLATLTEEVGRMSNTVDELLEMIKNSGGQGGNVAAGIAQHNNSPVAHELIWAKIGVVTEITVSKTFAAQAGAKYLVEVWGGGGSGGGVQGADNAYGNGAGGGSSGGYVRKIITFAQAANVPVTIGAGGLGIVGDSADGGASSFGSYLTAAGGLKGGRGGAVANAARAAVGGGASGVGSNPGLAAVIYNSASPASSYTAGGHGGGSEVGRSGSARGVNPNETGGAGFDAAGYNAGGGGAAAFGNNSFKGGDGAPGLVRITRLA